MLSSTSRWMGRREHDSDILKVGLLLWLIKLVYILSRPSRGHQSERKKVKYYNKKYTHIRANADTLQPTSKASPCGPDTLLTSHLIVLKNKVKLNQLPCVHENQPLHPRDFPVNEALNSTRGWRVVCSARHTKKQKAGLRKVRAWVCNRFFLSLVLNGSPKI